MRRAKDPGKRFHPGLRPLQSWRFDPVHLQSRLHDGRTAHYRVSSKLQLEWPDSQMYVLHYALKLTTIHGFSFFFRSPSLFVSWNDDQRPNVIGKVLLQNWGEHNIHMRRRLDIARRCYAQMLEEWKMVQRHSHMR